MCWSRLLSFSWFIWRFGTESAYRSLNNTGYNTQERLIGGPVCHLNIFKVSNLLYSRLRTNHWQYKVSIHNTYRRQLQKGGIYWHRLRFCHHWGSVLARTRTASLYWVPASVCLSLRKRMLRGCVQSQCDQVICSEYSHNNCFWREDLSIYQLQSKMISDFILAHTLNALYVYLIQDLAISWDPHLLASIVAFDIQVACPATCTRGFPDYRVSKNRWKFRALLKFTTIVVSRDLQMYTVPSRTKCSDELILQNLLSIRLLHSGYDMYKMVKQLGLKSKFEHEQC